MVDLLDTPVFSAFCRPCGEDYPSPSGSKMADKYEMRIDKHGHKTLEKVGETDIYAIIQESLEGTKIENIINRIMHGDVSMVRSGGAYFDATELPTSLMELQNLNIKIENSFNALPVEERAKYNHNVGEYIKHLDEELQEKAKVLMNEENGNVKPVSPVSEEPVAGNVS